MKRIRFGEVAVSALFIFSGNVLKKVNANTAEDVKSQQVFLFTDGTLVTLKSKADATMSNEEFIRYMIILREARKIKA
jgi:hypothetical protein